MSDRRHDQRTKNQEKEAKQLEEKRRKKQEEKKNRGQVMRHLKVEKQRSEPPKIIRTREVKKTLTYRCY